MKRKKKSKEVLSIGLINSLLFVLESAVDALAKHNFNLAEVWVGEYFEKLPQQGMDQGIAKKVYHALQRRDAEFLRAAVDAEIERLRTEKVKLLREKIVGAAPSS